MKFLLFSLLLLSASPGWALPPEQTITPEQLTPEQLTPEQVKQNAENFHILDVRSSEEYAEGHVPGAVNIPYDAIQAHAGLLPADTDAPLVLYCRSGRRAGLAAAELNKMGYSNLFVMQGDMPGWTEKGFNIAHD